MRTRLIFVRHGESVHQVEGVVGGPHGCRGLTEAGHQQAHRLAGRLADELAVSGPVAVYSSVLRRAVETAWPIASALGVSPVADCGLCAWHTPPYADGLPTARFHAERAVEGGGIFRPFEEGNENWAELVVRVGRAIMDIAHRHRGGNVVLVGHTETVEASFHALAAQPLFRGFDMDVAPASITEWTTDGDPTGWPPPRWTLRRFSDVS
ncbi:histidine phosphatase family protein [Micromonospora okii]|uniref:histidine phosphatase family protein n=1 Tax=Micromonospora okii TaxID=1182970 RepID=UPI001E40A178|nr:histidine phosphatase family protein [Micromonospora okii]